MSIDRFLDKARQVLAAGTALTMITLSATPPAQADWVDSATGWFKQRADDGADLFGSLMGGTVSFGAAVAKAGCNAGPYDGQDLTGILAVSFLYADSAMDAYLAGLSHAEKAVGIKEEQGRVVFESISDLVVRPNYGNSFRNFSEVDHTSDRNEVLVAQLKEQAAAGFSDAAEQDLTQAIASLYTANELQAQAVVGLLLVAGYVKMAHDRGEGRYVVGLLSQEISRNGADSSVRTLTKSPEAMFKLVSNFADAFSLTSSLERAVDFDVEEDELRRLGVEQDLAAISALAEQRARAAAKPEAQAIAFRPGGETIRVMLSSTGLVDDRISGIAVGFLSMACGGVFGHQDADVSGTNPPRDSEPAFGHKEYKEGQTILIYLGHLKGSADGAWGPMSRAAMQQFQRENDLAPTSGELNLRLLDELRQAKGGETDIVGAPVSSALQQVPGDTVPSAGDIRGKVLEDAREATDQVLDMFKSAWPGGSNN